MYTQILCNPSGNELIATSVNIYKVLFGIFSLIHFNVLKFHNIEINKNVFHKSKCFNIIINHEYYAYSDLN